MQRRKLEEKVVHAVTVEQIPCMSRKTVIL